MSPLENMSPPVSAGESFTHALEQFIAAERENHEQQNDVYTFWEKREAARRKLGEARVELARRVNQLEHQP